MTADLLACLPPELQARAPTFAKIAAGLSGAGVYRVEADGRAAVLKCASERDSLAIWRGRLHVQEAAGRAGVAPRVVHADETRRAIVSELVVDRSFPAFYMNPSTHAAALERLASALRAVHALPVPDGVAPADMLAFLQKLWSGLAGFAVPAFVADVVRRLIDEPPPPADRAPVMSHNDANPSNLVFDGERVLLLDWDTAGPNDPFYDLAAVAVFLRMDDATCARLIALHDGAPVAALPARFAYQRRFIAGLCGTMFLHLAHVAGHAGAGGAETIDTAPTLGDCHQQMRAGALDLATAVGRFRFGLALLRASAELSP